MPLGLRFVLVEKIYLTVDVTIPFSLVAPTIATEGVKGSSPGALCKLFQFRIRDVTIVTENVSYGSYIPQLCVQSDATTLIT